jgi:hypothetical protein
LSSGKTNRPASSFRRWSSVTYSPTRPIATVSVASTAHFLFLPTSVLSRMGANGENRKNKNSLRRR